MGQGGWRAAIARVYRNGMSDGLPPRVLLALFVAAVAAGAVFAIGGDLATALVALVGAAAAALLGTGAGEEPPVPAPAPPPTEPLLGPALDAVTEPLLLIERDGVMLANAAARALLGDHIVGEDVRVAIRHPAATERLRQRDDAGPGRPVELVGLGPLDQRWEMRVTPLGDERRLVQLVDQTGNYAAERMRVDFVANASHELRTPLASILGFIETLEEAGDEPAIRARFLGIMGGEAHRMQRLVEDLISLSRIEAEKYRLPSAAVDLADLVEEVCEELAPVSEAGGHALLVTAEAVPPVGGDRAQLSQALHNLIGNAMKYGRAGTPVRIILGHDGPGMIRLSVADEGEGIAPEHIPRLTERFYRVDAGRSRTLGGTGLGLAIVKHIVERHRGRLDIASQPGIGTTVALTLPVLSSPVLSSPVLSSASHATVTGARG